MEFPIATLWIFNLQLSVFLFYNKYRVDIENKVEKLPSTEPQEVHFMFPFAVPGGKCHYDGPGAIIRPENVSAGGDHLAGSGRQMYSVQNFVDVSNENYGVTLANIDSMLVQFGHRTTREYPLEPGISDNAVLSLVMTNKQPEMRQNQAGNRDFTFRYSIQAHKGGFMPENSFKFGMERNIPPIVIAIDDMESTAADTPVKQFIRIDREDVVVSAFKPAELETESLVLRLRDVGGKGGKVSIEFKDIKLIKVYAVDLVERDKEEIIPNNNKVGIDILPYGYASLKLVLK